MDLKRIAGRVVWLVVATALTACHPKRQPDAPLPVAQTISLGDALVLLQPLSLAADTPSIFFQDGQRVQGDEVIETTVYCQLRFSKAQSAKDALEPQTFQVTDVIYDEEEAASAAPTQVTKLLLRSTQTTDTGTMTCRRPKGPAASETITPEEIASVLRGYFSIRNP